MGYYRITCRDCGFQWRAVLDTEGWPAAVHPIHHKQIDLELSANCHFSEVRHCVECRIRVRKGQVIYSMNKWMMAFRALREGWDYARLLIRELK